MVEMVVKLVTVGVRKKIDLDLLKPQEDMAEMVEKEEWLEEVEMEGR